MIDPSKPLSPHLQVYRLPLLALLSIANRITGVALSIVLVLLPFYLLAAAVNPECFLWMQNQFASWYGRLLLFLSTIAFAYHTLNGIRHLVWDAGKNLDVEQAESSGKLTLVLTILLTAAVWVVAYWF